MMQDTKINMDIKKLIIVTLFVVGLTPNNTRTECGQCQYAQSMNQGNGSGWQIVADDEDQDEQEAAEPLIEFVKEHRAPNQCARLPRYESHPANVSYHTQTTPCNMNPEDPYAPCDTQFEEREMEEEQEQQEGQPYVVIYRVK